MAVIKAFCTEVRKKELTMGLSRGCRCYRCCSPSFIFHNNIVAAHIDDGFAGVADVTGVTVLKV